MITPLLGDSTALLAWRFLHAGQAQPLYQWLNPRETAQHPQAASLAFTKGADRGRSTPQLRDSHCPRPQESPRLGKFLETRVLRLSLLGCLAAASSQQSLPGLGADCPRRVASPRAHRPTGTLAHTKLGAASAVARSAQPQAAPAPCQACPGLQLGLLRTRLCPSLPLFHASVSLRLSLSVSLSSFPSHPLLPHPPPSPRQPPLLPHQPRGTEIVFWGSLERGATPSPERLERLPAPAQELQSQDPSVPPEQRRNETPTSRHPPASLPPKEELLGRLPFL